MTSNVAEEWYEKIGYDKVLDNYKNTLDRMVGPTKIMISGDTLQVNDYERYNWTMFDSDAKKERHEKVFPEDKQKVFSLGAKMVARVAAKEIPILPL